MTEAVKYLHDQGIVHRDLKPENLLFRDKSESAELLIADFGLSRVVDGDKLTMLSTTCGTPGYMAPEIFKKTGHSFPVDMWAIGVITYFLLCGYTPFDRDSSMAEMAAIVSGDYRYEPAIYWEGVSTSARNFIDQLLVVDPAQRMTADQALAHPWLAHVSVHGPPKEGDKEKDLLPGMKTAFNAKRTFRKAVHGIRLMNRLKSVTAEHQRQAAAAEQAHAAHAAQAATTSTTTTTTTATTSASGNSSTEQQQVHNDAQEDGSEAIVDIQREIQVNESEETPENVLAQQESDSR